MNIKRFKKIIAVYIFMFIIACAFIPFNVTFHATHTPTKSKIDEIYIDRGLWFEFVGTARYENNQHRMYNGKLYYGYYEYDPNILMLVSELLGLTLLFAGVSYISCKRSERSSGNKEISK